MAVALSKGSCAPLVTGGYDCDFVEPPPDSLLCPVCLLPFLDPSLLSCCGHKGCASCIGRIRAAGHPCPLCQQPFDTMLDKQFQRKVLDLRVYCSKKDEGCVWEGELRHLQTHTQRDCSHVAVECRYKCGGSYKRNLLQSHEMDECPQRPPEVITQSLMRKMVERIHKLEVAYDEKVTELQSAIRDIDNAQQEDHTKLEALQKCHQDDQAKLAAVEQALREAQANLSQQIQELQKENTSLQDEKRKMARKVQELEGQLQQSENIHSVESQGQKQELNPKQQHPSKWSVTVSESFIIENPEIKPCPQCRIGTKKIGVAGHISCSHCFFEWCWVCGVAWNSQCQRDQHWFG